MAIISSSCVAPNKRSIDGTNKTDNLEYCKSVGDVITRDDPLCGPYYDRVKAELELDKKRDADTARAREEMEKRAIEAAANAPRNPPGAKFFSLAGSLSLIDSGFDESNGNCSGVRGFSDIQSGMQVTVMDEESRILATGALGPGKRLGNYHCKFEFEITDIPVSSFYSIKLGSSGRRGALNYSFDEMQKNNWGVSFSISSV